MANKGKIVGKQILDQTIGQEKLNLKTPIINRDAATKEYVDGAISIEMLSTMNKGMSASSTVGLSGTVIGCITPILQDTVYDSQVRVLVNNITIDCGSGSYAFFSDDNGTTPKPSGLEKYGDILYWNTDTAPYQLESDDVIDFEYLTHAATYSSNNSDIIDGGII